MSLSNRFMIQCPYDSAHWISKERIQYHLVKCQKQHPHADLVKCPYNACHLVPKTKEAEHMAECPDRRIVEYQKYRFNAPTPGQHGFLANPEKYGSDDIPVEPLRDPDEDDHLEGEYT